MNQQLIKQLCQLYQIGSPLSEPIPCSGGLLHTTYRFATTQNQFIVKHLSKPVDRITESIARTLKETLSLITAITYQDNPLLTIENETFMLFPYVQAEILSPPQITLSHVIKIAEVLSRIHQINLQIKDAPAVEIPCLLDLDFPDIKLINEKIKQYEPILKNNLVISHRDLDPKNVLWDANGDYYIIDWELAGFINKTKDVIATAIYWSLDTHYQVNLSYFQAFLETYYQHHGLLNHNEIEAGLYGLLGDWLMWLQFNLSRPEQELGKQEVNKTRKATAVLLQQFPGIMKYGLEKIQTKKEFQENV